ERHAADAEGARRARDVAGVLGERAPEVLALEALDGGPQGLASGARGRGGLCLTALGVTRESGADFLRELRGRHLPTAGGEADGTLELVLQLAHVPGPLVGLEERERRRLDPRELLLEPGRGAAEEMLDEERDVVAALAQRR